MLVVTCTPFVLSNVLVSRLTPQNVPKPGKKDQLGDYRANKKKAVDVLSPRVKLQQSKND